MAAINFAPVMEPETYNRLHPIRALLVYMFVVFLGGALLAPWLYWATQPFAAHFGFAMGPFHRFVNRSLLGLALIGIWPLLRNLGANSLRDVGIVKPAGQWKLLLGGFALGFGSLACVAVIVLAAHGRNLNADLTAMQVSGNVAGAAATAIIVAVIEEILFRGAIFGALRKIWDWRLALVVSSMIYAIVHFMQSADLPGHVTWLSGLKLLPLMLRGFGNWDAIIPAFFSLTLVGILLGLAYQRTGNLYFSIGLHAGWIFWLRAYGLLTRPVDGDASHPFFGSQKLTDGWLTLCVLAVVLLVLPFLPLGKPKEVPE
ncbi:MAG: amino terminal protease family [Pedosphaera sp.]|nr:amino terminal protease family [Pedosphaera sp.]